MAKQVRKRDTAATPLSKGEVAKLRKLLAGEAVPTGALADPISGPPLVSLVPVPPDGVEGTVHLCFGPPPGGGASFQHWDPLG